MVVLVMMLMFCELVVILAMVLIHSDGGVVLFSVMMLIHCEGMVMVMMVLW